MTTTETCVLTRKGARWAASGHPWVYRDDVDRIAGGHGDVVRVEYEGRPLGVAFRSAFSKIALRWVARGPDAAPPRLEDWVERLRAAIAARRSIDAEAYRVVHDVADGFPGLVVDRFGEVAVLQSTVAGMDRLLAPLAEALVEHLAVRTVIARCDAGVRKLEGLPLETRVLVGDAPERLWVRERGPLREVEYAVDPLGGQKTGAYLDQRENRHEAARRAHGRMLDAFSHIGLFSLHASPAIDEAVAIDTSGPALALLTEACERTGIANVRGEKANVFEWLGEAEARGDRFDIVALDPPAFAKSRRDVPAAVRGYREINRRAMKLLPAGGTLITCSCSYNLGESDFLDLLREAAADARSDFHVVERRGAAADHPVLLSHPESAYLKCIVLEKT